MNAVAQVEKSRPLYFTKLTQFAPGGNFEHFFLRVTLINFLLLSFTPQFYSAHGYTEVMNLIEKAADVSEAFAQHQAG